MRLDTGSGWGGLFGFGYTLGGSYVYVEETASEEVEGTATEEVKENSFDDLTLVDLFELAKTVSEKDAYRILERIISSGRWEGLSDQVMSRIFTRYPDLSSGKKIEGLLFQSAKNPEQLNDLDPGTTIRPSAFSALCERLSRSGQKLKVDTAVDLMSIFVANTSSQMQWYHIPGTFNKLVGAGFEVLFKGIAFSKYADYCEKFFEQMAQENRIVIDPGRRRIFGVIESLYDGPLKTGHFRELCSKQYPQLANQYNTISEK